MEQEPHEGWPFDLDIVRLRRPTILEEGDEEHDEEDPERDGEAGPDVALDHIPGIEQEDEKDRGHRPDRDRESAQCRHGKPPSEQGPCPAYFTVSVTRSA